MATSSSRMSWIQQSAKKLKDKVTRDSWKRSDMPSWTAELPYEQSFSHDEFGRLSAGLLPRSMEDKWFVYVEENLLHLHRSWTGSCIYKVELKPEVTGYSVVRAIVNRDAAQYRETDDDYDSALLGFLIDNLLLGKQTPFPHRNDRPEPKRGVQQHHFSGTGYSEQEFRKGSNKV